jgi:hypothetical protein
MSSPSKVTQTNKVELSPEQRELINQGMKLTGQVTDQPPHMPQVPGFDPLQSQGQQAIIDTATSGGLKDTTDKLTGAQNFLLGDVLDVNKNPALRGAVDAAVRPLSEAFNEQVIPGINRAAVGTGPFSSFATTKTMQNKALAGDRYMQQVGDTSSKMVSDAYLAGLDAMTKGVALAPGTQRAQLFPGTAISAVGDVRRGLAQEQAQQGFEDEMFPFTMGLQLLGAAGATPGGGSTGTVSGAQPGNPLMQLAGTALSIIPFL